MTSISPELAMRRINPELKKNSYVMNFLKFYFTNQRAAKDITIFSMDGLKLFMQTGLCYELPEGCCDAFSIEERIAIMDSFMQKAETGQLIPILVRDEQLKLSPELVITVYNFRNPIFMWHLPEIPFSSCYIQEAGIQNSIMDFLIYIQNAEDITYSRQESLAILKEYMNNHFQY